MKVRYDKNEDILMIQLAKKKIDDAYEKDGMIVHVTQDREPVLLEIFDATSFLIDLNKSIPSEIKTAVFVQ